MKKFTLVAALLCATLAAATGPTIVGTPDTNTANHAGSISKAYSTNPTSGLLLIATVGVYKRTGSVYGLGEITVASTNNGTWSLACYSVDASGHGSFMFYVSSSASGADTVTATVGGSGTGDLDIIIAKYSGQSSYPFDGCAPGSNTDQGSPVVTGTVYSGNSTGDTRIATAYNYNASGLTFTFPGGYTRQATTSNTGGGEASSLGDDNAGTAALTGYSASVTVSGGGTGNHALLALFRSINPTFGVLQFAPCTATSVSSSTTCAFSLPNTAGNTIVVVGYTNITAPSYAYLSPGDSQSNSYSSAPAGIGPCSNGQTCTWAASNINAGANTVTLTLAGSTATVWSIIYEITGAASVYPVSGISVNSPPTSSDSGYVNPTSSALLMAIVAGSPAQTYTVSGFLPVAATNDGSLQSFTQNVTAGAYHNAVSSSSGFVNELLSVQSTSYGAVRPVAAGGNYSDIGLTYTWTATAADALLVCGQAYGASSLGMSDNQSDTFVPVATGNTSVAAWYALGIHGGSTTATLSAPGGTYSGFQLVEYTGVSRLEGSSYGSSTSSTTVSTGSLTTVDATVMLATCAWDLSRKGQYMTAATPWSTRSYGGGDHVQTADVFDQLVGTTGAYSNTITGTNSDTWVALIVGLTNSAGGAQPSVSIITETLGRRFAEFGD